MLVTEKCVTSPEGMYYQSLRGVLSFKKNVSIQRAYKNNFFFFLQKLDLFLVFIYLTDY